MSVFSVDFLVRGFQTCGYCPCHHYEAGLDGMAPHKNLILGGEQALG